MTGNWGIGTRCVITVYYISSFFVFCCAQCVCAYGDAGGERVCMEGGEGS